MALIYTWYGAAMLAAAFVLTARLAVSPAWRARCSAGGRDWRLLLALVGSLGVAALVSGQFAHGSFWPVLLVFVGLIWLNGHRRNTLSAIPAEELSPTMRRSLQAPLPAELLRHPWRSTRTNLRVIRETLAPASWRADRQWERDRGLR